MPAGAATMSPWSSGPLCSSLSDSVPVDSPRLSTALVGFQRTGRLLERPALRSLDLARWPSQIGQRPWTPAAARSLSPKGRAGTVRRVDETPSSDGSDHLTEAIVE